MSIISATILLFLVMDPFGNIPLFLGALKTVPEEKRTKVAARELSIALMILLAFLFTGCKILETMHISSPSLHIAGGVILFMIAVKMVFGGTDEMFKGTPDGEPMIVPLAVPYVAGPSSIATVLLLVGQEPDRWREWFFALLMAWGANCLVLLSSTKLAAVLKDRGLCAIERLMGLILTAISVEMLLNGVKVFIKNLR